MSASGVNVSATGDRTVTTLARATQGGAAPGSPNPTQGQQTLTNNDAKTPDGSVNVAGAVAVTNLTGDTNATVSGGSRDLERCTARRHRQRGQPSDHDRRRQPGQRRRRARAWASRSPSATPTPTASPRWAARRA